MDFYSDSLDSLQSNKHCFFHCTTVTKMFYCRQRESAGRRALQAIATSPFVVCRPCSTAAYAAPVLMPHVWTSCALKDRLAFCASHRTQVPAHLHVPAQAASTHLVLALLFHHPHAQGSSSSMAPGSLSTQVVQH